VCVCVSTRVGETGRKEVRRHIHTQSRGKWLIGPLFSLSGYALTLAAVLACACVSVLACACVSVLACACVSVLACAFVSVLAYACLYVRGWVHVCTCVCA
jgi:hypothetical protein